MLRQIMLLSCSVGLCLQSVAHAGVALKHWRTSKNTPVYYVHAPQVPIIDIRVAFAAGSSRDGDLSGLASLTNDMLAEGTEGADANQIAETFETVGAVYSDAVDKDMSKYSLRSLSDAHYFQPALSMFTRVLSKPTFPEKAFARIKETQLASIRQAMQSPQHVANKAFYKSIYADSPYANPVSGELDTVNSISAADCNYFFKHYYVAQNAVIAIVGDVDETKAKQIAESISQAMPSGKHAKNLPEIGNAKTANVKISFPSTQTIIRIGQLGIARSSKDYFPLIVGNYTLGGGPLTSRLAKTVREDQGLAYDVYSYFLPLVNKGPFIISLGTQTKTSQRALTTVNTTLSTFLKQGPSADEVTAAKRYLTGSFPLRLDSNSKIASTLLAIGFYNLPLDYLDTYVANVNAVDAATIKATFARTIRPEKMVTVMVGRNGENGKS